MRIAGNQERSYTRRMIKRMTMFVGVVCSLAAVSASAQVRSLADLRPDEKYVSTEGGFEVALPNNPVVQHDPKTGTLLTWVVKEGVIVINYWNRGLDAVSAPKGTPRSELVEEFVQEYKDGLENELQAELGENKPSKIAGLDVTFFLTKIGERSGVSSVYVEDHRSIVFLLVPLAEVPDSSDALSEALETFRLIPKTK